MSSKSEPITDDQRRAFIAIFSPEIAQLAAIIDASDSPRHPDIQLAVRRQLRDGERLISLTERLPHSREEWTDALTEYREAAANSIETMNLLKN